MNEHEDERETQLAMALMNHFRSFFCVPFPAGPRVPRRLSHQPPPIQFGLTNPIRAQRAMGMLAGVFGEYAQADPLTLGLNHHLWAASVEWASRHQQKELKLEALRNDFPMLLEAIYLLCSDPPEVIFTDALVSKIAARRAELRRAFSSAKRARLDEREVDYLYPFAATHYDCTCCESLQPAVEDEFAAPDDSEVKFVASRCESPDGAWPLLAMLFLKLLFSHFGYMAVKPHMAERLKLFFTPVRRILLRIVRDGDGGLAEAAAGLAAYLPKIAPLYTKKGSDIEWHADASELPDCFNAYLLGGESRTRDEAVAIFGRMYRNQMSQTRPESAGVNKLAYPDVDAPLAGLALDVVDLAREVASVLTDPLAAPALSALGFDRAAFKALHQALYDQRRLFPELKPGGLANNSGSGGFIERCVPPADAARVFAPRMRRLIEYTHWMSEQGIDAVTRAANAP